jgi:hypothetical protein
VLGKPIEVVARNRSRPAFLIGNARAVPGEIAIAILFFCAASDEEIEARQDLAALPQPELVGAKNGRIREDGRMIHDMYVVRVKKPNESRYPWDYYEIQATIAAEEAFQPLAKGACPLVRK